jgi:hypothetical protein
MKIQAKCLGLIGSLLFSVNSWGGCLETYSSQKAEAVQIISESGYHEVIKTSEKITQNSVLTGVSLMTLSLLDGGATLLGALLGGAIGGSATGGFISIPIVVIYESIMLEDGIREVVEEHLLLEESTVFMESIIERNPDVLNRLMSKVWLEIDHKITKDEYINRLLDLDANNSFCVDDQIASPDTIHTQVYNALKLNLQ